MSDTSDFSSGQAFGTIELDGASFDVAKFHAHVLRYSGRVQIMCGGQCCVLISKAELDSLEEALQILSNTESVRQMRNEIATVARMSLQSEAGAEMALQSALNARLQSFNLP